MKQELPFAVTLLAAGCLLCFSHFNTSDPQSSPTVSQAAVSDSAITGMLPPQARKHDVDSADQTGNSFVVSQTAHIEDLPATAETVSSEEQGTAIQESNNRKRITASGSANGFIHATTNPQSVQFLASLANRIAESPPIGSSLQLTGSIYGQIVSATGNYYQMGGGTNKSRIELSFGSLPDSPNVFQLCDGRFVYKLQTEGQNRTFEFVDLMRIRDSADEVESGMTATGWVATGGLSSLIQHLTSAFNFGELEFKDETTVVLRGSWDKSALLQITNLAKNGSDPFDSIEDLDWKDIPDQLPHAVEIEFREDRTMGFFPKRVSFMSFSQELKSGRLVSQPKLALEFSPPTRLTDLSNRFFVIDPANVDSTDLTDQYIARIEAFERILETAKAFTTIDR